MDQPMTKLTIKPHSYNIKRHNRVIEQIHQELPKEVPIYSIKRYNDGFCKNFLVNEYTKLLTQKSHKTVLKHQNYHINTTFVLTFFN